MTSLWLSEDSGPHAYIPKPEKFLQKQTIRTFNNGLKSEKREANTSNKLCTHFLTKSPNPMQNV